MEGHIDVLKFIVTSSQNPIECILARNDRGEIPKDCAIQFYKKKCIDYLEQIGKVNFMQKWTLWMNFWLFFVFFGAILTVFRIACRLPSVKSVMIQL